MPRFVKLITLVSFACAALSAAPFGTISLTGVGDVRVGLSFVDWGTLGPVFNDPYTNCVPFANPGACNIDGTTVGSVFVTDGTGTFAGIAGSAGTLLDLEDDFAPVGVPISLSGFLSLAARPGVTFVATLVPFGAGTPAGCNSVAGSVCTPAGSPFTITNTSATSATVSLRVLGHAYDADGILVDYEGAFSTQFNDLSAAGILNQIATVGYAQSSHSADFTLNPIPEPSTAILFGCAAMLLLAGTVRRSRRA